MSYPNAFDQNPFTLLSQPFDPDLYNSMKEFDVFSNDFNIEKMKDEEDKELLRMEVKKNIDVATYFNMRNFDYSRKSQ